MARTAVAPRFQRFADIELDLQLQVKWRRLLAAIKYADYDADQYLTDTTKYWVQVDYVW